MLSPETTERVDFSWCLTMLILEKESQSFAVESLKKNDVCYQAEAGEEAARDVAETIQAWLQHMNKSLNYIYDHEASYDDVEEDISLSEDRLCDPFVDNIEDETIEEIRNLVNNKKVSSIQGKCNVRLKDGTEVIGRWINGVRTGPGSLFSPRLEKFGVTMLAGNYCDGYLSGVGRAHMKVSSDWSTDWSFN